MGNRCKFWLPKKKRFCANASLGDSLFCGNHSQRSDSQWIPCPVDPSHSVLQENLDGHLKRCPFIKKAQSLSFQPYYQKGINSGKEEDDEVETLTVNLTGVKDVVSSTKSTSCSLDIVTSEMKRNAVYSMTFPQFYGLLRKIELVHGTISKDIRDSYKMPEACNMWIKREVDSKLPFQEKHVLQQASILGNLEDFGVLKESINGQHHESEGPYEDGGVPAVVEFGAGRGYLTQMLADCYGIKKVFLVERKSYKLKADRSLRQKERLILERLRIDIEDLNLGAVESLHGFTYVAVGKHLCGPATDLTLRCCLAKHSVEDKLNIEQHGCSPLLRGLAIATCCHHLCQWKHYINKKYLSERGISKEDFHAITWFTSWAVDADHGSDLPDVIDCRIRKEETAEHSSSVEDLIRKMEPSERAILGFMCKQIIDMGRLMWINECGLEAELVKYVPSSISPENSLLIAGHASQS